MSAADFVPVIGLEVHVQLATRTKLFCGDSTAFGAEPNTRVCPVCLGLPGALPVPNGRAVELAIRAALGLGCVVHETSIFARKNYFYPDLPKGYQITQYDRPLATGGSLLAPVEPGATGDWAAALEALDAASSRRPSAANGVPSADPDPRTSTSTSTLLPVRIRRIHLEEDAGKSVHDRFAGLTAVDLNRTGVPLIEIVTEPDLVGPGHARAFLNRLKQALQYLEVSDCDMEKGSLRVDANASLRREGERELGTKTELKNMNSFANVERALAFEIERQTALLARGDAVVHETLLWDPARGEARPMRAKEEMHDYRYFPDPDLPPLRVEPARIDEIRDALPELPDARLRRLRSAYGLPAYDAEVLVASRAVADYFEALAREAGDAKAASNWVMTEVLGWLNQRQADMGEFPVPAARLAQLLRLVADGTVSTTMARTVFGRMAETGRPAAVIVEEEGLAQVRDEDRLERWADAAVAAHPEAAERYRAGEARVFGFFMGEVMKASRGKADPRRAAAVLRRLLESEP